MTSKKRAFMIILLVSFCTFNFMHYALAIQLSWSGKSKGGFFTFVTPVFASDTADEVRNNVDSCTLWIVNKENPLPSDYIPSGLTELKGVKIQQNVHTAFIKMLEAMEKDGVQGLKLQSGYRSYQYQSIIFKKKVRSLLGTSNPTQEASMTVQPPGSSEHQMGLAVDVSINGDLTQAFGDTAAGKWLATHCHKYGFIIRYPSTKIDVTHIVYEPWHLRYVGHPHASIMTKHNLALEEYIKYLQNVETYIFWDNCDGYYIISYQMGNDINFSGKVEHFSSLLGVPGYVFTIYNKYPQLWGQK